ncbi:MAG: prefoldin subunit [Nanoarchaeota archaeon]
MASAKVQQLQLLQQNLQALLTQKQQLQNQLVELESATRELKTTEKAYRIIGKIMLATSTEGLAKDLQEKKEVAELRIQSVEKQEEKLNQMMETVQKEMLKDLKR